MLTSKARGVPLRIWLIAVFQPKGIISMTVHKTDISWTNSTWNPTVGCTAISDGCAFCYARVIVNRFMDHAFEDVRLHPERIAQGAKFRPIKTPDGLVPRLVFVNSMSDLMHEQIPEPFRDLVFDAMEANTGAAFQVLSKRQSTMRRYITDRYRGRGVPPNIWLGLTVEGPKVRLRIDTLRRMKDDLGDFCAFLSVEPLIGDPQSMTFHGMDWILVGGESGPGARDCQVEWIRTAVNLGIEAKAAVWFKQFGQWANNPLYQERCGLVRLDRIRNAIAAGEQLAQIGMNKAGRPIVTGEQGGATLDGRTWRQWPVAFHSHSERLRASALA
jgi:protein gp37